MELGAEFLLESDAHFSNQRVNVSMSSVQLPTNVYNKGDVPSPLGCLGDRMRILEGFKYFVSVFPRIPTGHWLSLQPP